MNLNQEAKNLIAIMALVGALALVLNDFALEGDGRDLLSWSFGLLLVSIFFWIWMRRDALADNRDQAIAAAEEAARQAEALAKRKVVTSESARPADAALGAAIVTPDDLTRLKGIAGGYQRILNDADIHTYADLADKSAEELRAVFNAAGRAAPVKVETVPRQAEFALKGDWDGLRAFQDSI